MRGIVKLACFALLPAAVFGQTPDHVHWSVTAPPSASPGKATVAKLTATIDPGWHLYSLTTPQPGPIPTKIRIGNGAAAGIEAIYQQAPKVQFDEAFGRNTETYEGSADFFVRVKIKPDLPAGDAVLILEPRYQVCSGTSCIPPVTRMAQTAVRIDPSAPGNAASIPAGFQPVSLAAANSTTSVTPTQNAGGWLFLLTAFGFGLASIFTPCVFPMIPITVSFFLNQQGAAGAAPRPRSFALRQAALFCLGIVVLFSAIGMIITAVLGPFGVVQLGSNPWVNAFIVAIFTVFGLSLLGAFEITIPSAVLNRLDSASRGSGTLPTLLMGLTFSLASFACVGPFVGPLLAASVTGGLWRPLAGMAVFAAGLALPFFALALFPAYLKKLPRSGGWLARVKVVMGFIILAAALKYLASIDQVLQWNFLTRERFLAAWVVLFAVAGLYLLGFVRLEGVSKDEPLGIGRLLIGMALVIFAVTLVPGMFGGRLGELEGFVPPPQAGSPFAGAQSPGNQLVWLKNDFEGAVRQARAGHKRVFVNFTGYACTNCHWMKQNMFTKPEIASVMHDMVLVDLYTDADDPVSQANQRLEQSRFHTVAIPFYVLYDPGPEGAEPRLLATFPGLTRDANQYLAFLNTPSPAASPETVSEQTAAPSSPEPAGPATSPQPTSPQFPGATTLAGAPIDPAKFGGKVVIANFWATWCVPCRKEIPEFNALQASLGSRGLEIIGVSVGEDDAAAVQTFLEKHPIHYTVELAGEPAKTAYHVDQLPVTLVFDRSGRIAGRFEGYTPPDKIRGVVLKLL